MKQQINFRASDLTVRQVAELISATGMSQTELISTAIDRMYREEINLNTVINQHGKSIDFAAAVNLMDDNLREQIHDDLAPCTEQEFFNEYARRHRQKYGTDWEPAKANPVW